MAASRAPTRATNPSCREFDSSPFIARRSGGGVAIDAGVLTAMSGRDDVGACQQATPRGSFPVAYSVLRFAAVLLTLAPGLTMTSFGCVLPLAPSFDDPPAERNYAPTLAQSLPPQGIAGLGPLSVTVSDPNVGDSLVVRWIADFPPYNSDRTRILLEQDISSSADGRPLYATRETPSLNCFYLAPGNSHPVMALVADRPFFTRAEAPNLSDAELLTALPTNALSVEAHWVLDIPCSQ
jgi:hypothetical protein